MLLRLLAAVTAAFIFGIRCATLTAWPLPVVVLAFSVLVVLVLRQIWKGKESFWMFIVLFFFAGIVRSLHADVIRTDDISHYAGQMVRVRGVVAGVPVEQETNEKRKISFVLETDFLRRENEKAVPVSGKVKLTVIGQGNRMNYRLGDGMEVSGRLLPLHGYNNPGMYDFVGALGREGIYSRMAVRETAVNRRAASGKFSAMAAVVAAKRDIIQKMKQVMPHKDAAVLSGMLFGGYEGIPAEVVHDFAATGLVHILSVSGSHIALVGGLIMVVGGWFQRRFGFHEQLGALAAGLTIVVYSFFCGLTPPVLRSLFMGLIVLGGICFEREKNAAAALCITTLALLGYQPDWIYDLSFELSFGATAGLVFLYARTVKKLWFLPKPVAETVAVTLAAQLGVLPFQAWYFNSLSLSSVLANLLIGPIIDAVIMIGLCGCLTLYVWAGAGHLLLVTAGLLVAAMMFMAAWLARLPYAQLYLPATGLLAGVLYYLLLAWIYGYLPQRMGSIMSKVRGNRIWVYMACAMLFMLMAGWILYPQPVTVHFIDVGQGDAALIITPHRRAVLVDSGGIAGESSAFDIGERVVVPYLKHYGIQKLDYLFLSHGHQDHAGGAAAVAAAIPIKNILLARETPSGAVADLLRAAKAAVIIPVFQGQRILLDGVELRVVHASEETGPTQTGNEASDVLRIRYGKFSFLFTGDLEAAGEEEMVNSGEDIASTVLKVGHHGSKSSSTDAFLCKVSPQYAVISAGAGNSFGHPHAETLQRLKDNHMKILRTDRQGAIVFRTNGKEMSVDTFLQ
jgi:competence protein ComEC